MGDTFRIIGLFDEAANKEATRIIYSPMNYIDTNGSFTRGLAAEPGLTLYMLTK